MKYHLQTDLDILTPSIHEQINLILLTEDEKLRVLVDEYNEGSVSKINHKYLLLPECQDTLDLYWEFKAKIIAYFADQDLFDLKIYRMHQDLEDEIFNQLPAKIRNMPVPPFIRLQIMSNGDYFFPHIDTHANRWENQATLITSVGPNIETTWFWKVAEPHQFGAHTLPDIDKIERASSVKLRNGETWLFDINEVHSVERPLGYRLNNRVTINCRWSNIPISDVITALR